jgi:hypothetical protein
LRRIEYAEPNAGDGSESKKCQEGEQGDFNG